MFNQPGMVMKSQRIYRKPGVPLEMFKSLFESIVDHKWVKGIVWILGITVLVFSGIWLVLYPMAVL